MSEEQIHRKIFRDLCNFDEVMILANDVGGNNELFKQLS